MKGTPVIWHDVECGGYAADLTLWEELADSVDGAILELGCGSGRVALHLAQRGHTVVGLDIDDELVAAFGQRSVGLPAQAECEDARAFRLDANFALVLAPMQLIQLFPRRGERIACLSSVADHLQAGDRAAFALAEAVLPGTNERIDGSIAEPIAIPDTRELDGWVYSSLPLDTDVNRERIRVRRLRQTVAPNGELNEQVSEIDLQQLDADALEAEAARAGLKPAGRLNVDATEMHVGSTVVLLEKEV
jgi:SAM-dependent methyltransferase